ncbi:MAG: hypothetical protein A2953_02920 [Candidatus Levybacteria bacterium RIFCSPLOWO2_01_FULL_36_54]|nr:MAG: hypothetical protein A2953_02920 [Candidatus Levybacteria bacterium RIFCSPLOWO2_01_FULL_36_54]
MLAKRKIQLNHTKPYKNDNIDDAGKYWENKIYGRFKKEGLNYCKLDKGDGKKGRCIDCYVYKRGEKNEGFFCEIKSINSAGFDMDIKGYINSRDLNFSNAISIDNIDGATNQQKKYEYDYDHDGFVRKIEEALKDALTQYNDSNLSSFNVSKKGKPFVVVLCFDFVFFPDQVNFEQLLAQFPYISAVLTLERDYVRNKIKDRHLRELNEAFKNPNKNRYFLDNITKNWESDYNGTQDTINFRIHKNRLAQITFRPSLFFQQSIY